MDTYRIWVIIFLALIRVSSLEQGIKLNQSKSSLEQGQVWRTSGTPPPKFLFSTPPPGYPQGIEQDITLVQLCSRFVRHLKIFGS